MIPTIEWKNGMVRMLDQSLLPNKVVYIDCKTYQRVAQGIKALKIRGAPAIGIAAAMGIALAAQSIKAKNIFELKKKLEPVYEIFGKTRPTAVNLFWAIGRMKTFLEETEDLPVDHIKKLLIKASQKILEEDIKTNQTIGLHGNKVIQKKDAILTHCNAGSLATGGYGTALGVIRAAHFSDKNIRVFADETRPVLQGGRLTAWELMEDKIDVTLITDSMAGYLMSRGEINVCIVGADRIARNGDTANKIGTYSVAVLAKNHGIPFYVAAPLSTIDFSLRTGKEIPIEERHPSEVTSVFGKVQIAPKRVKVFNPAFDVTPARYITGIITEKGIFKPKDLKSLAKRF
ncbi:MAG: S-methyl-5-thioribose-1-phosphate isomerase [Nitrospirae bacterium]|nr:S-methyl-5-thioribose-1-phosphate isomerase [Nitrospirota bacterium]MBI3352408.1 S-methyl-5-thioribose-1-phosphate isomerase [Nitrospirota bacterium]